MYLRRIYICLAVLILGLGGFSVCHGQTLSQREHRYHLHPGDQISVEYRYTPEYNGTVYIEPDGSTSLPLLGEVTLSGLSLTEAHDLLLKKASERLNNPEITVTLKDFEKPYYIVGGEVTSPGRFDIRGRVTALRAVEMAGGFKSSAKSSQILLIRPIDDERAETKIIDLNKVLKKRQIDEDIQLEAGDMIVVPKSRLAKVEPYIRLVNTGFYLNPLEF